MTQSVAQRAKAPGQPSPQRRKVTRVVVGLLGLAAFLSAWQLAALSLHTVVFPTFTAALGAVWEIISGPALREDILPSIQRVLLGFLISAILGVVIGLTLGYVRWLGDYFTSLLNFLRSVPSPLLIPAALVIFGLGTQMVVAVIVSAAIWPVLLNAFDAARRIEPLFLDTARMCGLRGPELFRRTLLPASLPSIFAGLRVALSISLAVMVVAEILGATNGIGYRIQAATQTFSISQSYAGVLILAGLGWFFDTVFLAVERRFLAWENNMTGRAT